MHVGNLRTALYAYLVAKQSGGSFVLRIEDTDQKRLVDGAVEIIYDTLREAGLLWDEGPDIGGAYEPYIQSQRMDEYIKYADRLVALGAAYYCFCSKDELESRCALDDKDGAFRYDGHCRELSKQQIEQNLGDGKPWVIRQKMPREGSISFTDLVYGEISVDCAELEDQVLIKSDGMPTYNFANVIDDHLMDITCVIRGNEYLSSTPKYNLLYEAFGWDVPQYIHCPPVMRDATQKLSKRHGDASYQDLVAAGYLPEAIVNYLALLGWSPKGEREIFSLPELVAAFDVGGISKSPAIFDIEKLTYINAEYIRAMPPEAFESLAMPYINAAVARRDVDWRPILDALQPRLEHLTDIAPKLTFIDAVPDYDASLYENKKMKTDAATSKAALEDMLPLLESLEPFAQQNLHDALFSLIEQRGVKNGFYLYPLRVALSGLPTTPGGGIELAAALGKTETVARVKAAIQKLS